MSLVFKYVHLMKYLVLLEILPKFVYKGMFYNKSLLIQVPYAPWTYHYYLYNWIRAKSYAQAFQKWNRKQIETDRKADPEYH